MFRSEVQKMEKPIYDGLPWFWQAFLGKHEIAHGYCRSKQTAEKHAERCRRQNVQPNANRRLWNQGI